MAFDIKKAIDFKEVFSFTKWHSVDQKSVWQSDSANYGIKMFDEYFIKISCQKVWALKTFEYQSANFSI